MVSLVSENPDSEDDADQAEQYEKDALEHGDLLRFIQSNLIRGRAGPGDVEAVHLGSALKERQILTECWKSPCDSRGFNIRLFVEDSQICRFDVLTVEPRSSNTSQ